VGVILYEMISGRRAFPGDDISTTLASVLKDDVDWSAPWFAEFAARAKPKS
jgi:hypothetical protein